MTMNTVPWGVNLSGFAAVNLTIAGVCNCCVSAVAMETTRLVIKIACVQS